MRSVTKFFCIALCALTFTATASAEVVSRPPLAPLKDLDVRLDGKTLSMKELTAGKKVTLLHFWATWCPTCAEELPLLAQFANDLSERGGAVYAFALENSPTSHIRAFLNKHGAENFEAFATDRKTSMKTYGLRGIPTTLIVGSDGKLYEKWEGDRDWSEENMAEEVFNAVTR